MHNKKLTKLIFIVMSILSLTAKMHGQQHKISTVKFQFSHSLRIPEGDVSVEFTSHGDTVKVHVISKPKDTISERWRKTMQDYTFNLSKSKYNEVVNALLNINHKDIYNNLDFVGHDGVICEVEFGSFANGITYKIWSPNYDTKKRNLQSFLKACQLILKTAKLNPNKIL